MSTSRRDNARGQAGEVGKANGSQRRDSTASGFPSESLPEPAAAHHPHFSTTGEAQAVEFIAHHLAMAFAEADGPVWATAGGLAAALAPTLQTGISALRNEASA